MKTNKYICCLIGLFALISASNLAFGQYATVTSSWIDTNGKASNGEKALVLHYNLNVVGCYGHTITVSTDFQNEEGVYLFNKNNNKLTASAIHEIHYDNSNINDQKLVIPYSKFIVPSGRNTYYYQIIVTDKVTGGYLGSSDQTDFDMTGASSSGNSGNSNKTNNNSTQKTNSGRTASFSDLRFTGGYNDNGKDAFIFYYDVTTKGCSGRKVKVQLTFKDANGNYLYDKNNKKLIWSQTFDVKSANIKYTDQSLTVAVSQLNIPSDGKSYYYQFAAYDDKTGDFLGQSEKKELFLGNTVVFKNQRLTLNEFDNGKPVINYYFHLDCLLPEAHDLKLVCAVETDKNGHRHHFADGREMIQEYVWKNTKKWISGNIDGVMGFDHDEINPLPGKNTYWIRIYVYDNVTGKFLAESGALTFDAEDASAKNKTSNSNATQKASSNQSVEKKASSNQTTSPKAATSTNKKSAKGKTLKVKTY